MKKYLALVLIGMLLSPIFLFGQDKRQLNERKQFVSELKRQFASSREKEVNEFLDNELSKILLEEGLRFSEENFQRMKSTSEKIVENRHPAYPTVYDYVKAYYGIIHRGKSEQELNEWHQTTDELLNAKNPRRVRDFLAVSGGLFHQGIVYQDKNFQWISTDGDFTFEMKRSPLVRFENTNLVCRTFNRGRDQATNPYSDSIKINNTSGVLDINRNLWEGKNGIYTWEKVNLPKTKTFAELGNYSIKLSSTTFSADSVQLTTTYFNEKIYGRMMDRAARGSNQELNEGSFPSFSSYNANYEIKNLVKEVDYQGGFSLEGNEFVGVGNENQKAKLTYHSKGRELIISYSDQVRIKGDILKTPMARFTLYLGANDSITHTGLNVEYMIPSETIKFIRGNSPVTQSPFVNSYHKINMYVDEISLQRTTSTLTLGFDDKAADQQRTARFESFNFYDDQLFTRIQGIARVNPLTALYNYAWKFDKFEMSEGMAATALERTLEQAKPTLLELSTLGFISYDTDQGIVIVNEKTENFVKAKSGKIDFDNISFTSNLAPIRLDQANSTPEMAERINKRNQERALVREYGTIDLTSLDMKLNAVDDITISQNSYTTIYPDNNQVTFKENRKIIFAGWVNSGKWEVKIDNGNYDYEANKFNIFNSETAYFNVAPLRKEDGDRFIPLQSTISGIKGELIVNDISNRSGNKKGFEHYPTLISSEKSLVHYNHRSIHRGAYDKDRFYFEVEPFQVDSLLTFDEKNIRFKGELTSAGIFPKINDELKIMADYSLGFSKDVPSDGYVFYGTEAKYNNKILLSNNGLQGGGKIDFLTSSSISKSLFTFLPDSTIGVASYTNRPQEVGVQYPDADGPDVFITFLPREKVLKARSNDELISMYEGDSQFRGTTILTEKGMRGSGAVELPDAQMSSDNFDFKRWQALADTSSFQLKNKYKEEGDLTEDPLSFKTENVKGNLDFQERKGVFTSNMGESVVEFPVNQYVCKIDQFTWLMGKDEMTLEKKDEKELEDITITGDMNFVGPNFFSIHPRQDSLQFRSPKAKFDLKTNTIFAYETDFIEIADARIYPDSAKVVVRKKAKMDPFENAEIIANHITKYHKIVDANAVVTARRAYTATGKYEYGVEDGEKQYITLNKIFLDSSYQTVANGIVDISEDFMLSDNFGYYGKVSLRAADPYLTFNGATQLNHSCDKFSRNWMAFEAPINPTNIQIPIREDMNDLDGNKLFAGILWRNTSHIDSVNLYPTFLSAVENKDDVPIFSASGLLQYDASSNEFQIAPENKLINRGEVGNYISLHTQSCSMNGDGKINLGANYGQLEMEAVGVINYNQESDATDMNITLALRAPLHDKAFENIADRVNDVNGLREADFNSTTLEQALVEWIDLKTADKIKSDYTLKKEFRTVPRELRDAIVISGLRLSSYTVDGDQQRGLKTNTDQAILVNMYRKPIMKYVPLKMFAEYRPGIGDKLGLHIDIPGAYMYFFDYDFRREGIMSMLSSDPEFNDEIEKLNPKLKKERRFSFDITKKSSYLSQFLRVFN